MSVMLGEFPKNEKVSDWLQKGFTIELAKKEFRPIVINGKSYDDIRTYLENISEEDLSAVASLHFFPAKDNSLQHALLDFKTHRNKWYVTTDDNGNQLLFGEIYCLYVCKWNEDCQEYDAMLMYKKHDLMSKEEFDSALCNIDKKQ